ncbi:MAG: NUDIX domain-containing protein [Planctomycetota bacterium]
MQTSTTESPGRDLPGEIEFIARGVATFDAHILLCENAKYGYFYLPGGHVEPGESAAEALKREFEEELGVSPDVGPPLLVLEHRFGQRGRPRHEVNVVFHVEHIELAEQPAPPAAPQSREPELRFHWVDTARLLELDVRPEPIKAWMLARPDSAGADRPDWLSHAEINGGEASGSLDR